MTLTCCFSSTLSVKVIGIYGMTLSLLMINILVSSFFSTAEENDFVLILDSWRLFGLNWTYVLKNLKVIESAHTLLICVLIYSMLSLIANALLALGSFRKKSAYLIPWMYIQMASIIDQTISLSMQLTHDDKHQPLERSIWYFPACSIYLLISSFFWMVISSARKEWILHPQDAERAGAVSGTSLASLDNANMPKTPSYLSSSNAFIYDFSDPRSPIKHNIV